MLAEGPVSENVNERRPAATLNGVPTAASIKMAQTVAIVSSRRHQSSDQPQTRLRRRSIHDDVPAKGYHAPSAEYQHTLHSYSRGLLQQGHPCIPATNNQNDSDEDALLPML